MDLQIRQAEIARYDLKLREPFSYNGVTLNYLNYALVRVVCSNGIKGIGEAALAWDVTGETQEGALGVFEFMKHIILGKRLEDADSVSEIMEEVEAVFGNTGTKTALESALFDILGKATGKPVHSLFSGKARKKFVMLQKTFSFEEDGERLFESIEKDKKLGVKIFKFKIGRDFKDELNMLRAVRKKFKGIKIVLDSNQGWGYYKDALDFIRQIENREISWIEQPLKIFDLEGMAKLRVKSHIPIMADESCHNLSDLKILHKYRAADLVNIKLAKCGGILEALRMVSFCEKQGMKYMLGDMLHSSVGTAYNLHLAALGDFISYDLTLPERVLNDKGRGLTFNGFRAYIPDVPGLGVSLGK